jgi:hypothetical protein
MNIRIAAVPPEDVSGAVTGLGFSFPGCKSQVIHDLIFRSCQFSQLAIFDRQDIPTSSPRQAALGGIAERLMFMHAAAVTPTVRPGGFVMNIIQRSVSHSQSHHDVI